MMDIGVTVSVGAEGGDAAVCVIPASGLCSMTKLLGGGVST